MKNELLKRILSSIVLIPTTLFFIIKGSIFFNFFLLICFLITIFEWYKISKKISYSFFGIIFLIFSFYSIYSLRNEFSDNYLYLLFVAIICVATDIGGYIFGKTFKGPKLIKISPNKTYSGMIGGFFLSIILTTIYINYFNLIQKKIEFTIEIFFIVLLVSAVSQIGDIVISYFKRLSNIKNTGKIIPGHGGLLDRIDGMIFAFPFSYIILSLNFLI